MGGFNEALLDARILAFPPLADCQGILGHVLLDELVMVDLNIPSYHSGATHMSKEQKSNKESKKKPALSPKEKKSAKKDKKANKSHKGILD